MNFYFRLKHGDLHSRLTIPRFQNSGQVNNDMQLYQAVVSGNHWSVTALKSDSSSLFFAPVDSGDVDPIYFIASRSEVGGDEVTLDKLAVFNDFSSTVPDFRANLEIRNGQAGFSSYQSEYPFIMAKRHGVIVSSLATLTNRQADQNLLFFRNVFHLPEKKAGNGYIVSKKQRRVLRQIEMVTNTLTCITLSDDEIAADCYFVSTDMLGIPVFVSVAECGSVSMEHTHPPFSSVLGSRQVELTQRVKGEFLDILAENHR